MHENENLEWIRRAGRERLNPSITNANWLVLRRRRELFRRWLLEVPGNNLTVLDIGGRIQPYRPLLEGRVARYVAIDLARSPLVEVVAQGEQLPLPDDSFDLVICTQVLEYVHSPARMVEEVHRALRPGGRLLLSAPAVFPRDSEQDLWRFTSAGLAKLLAGFGEVTVEAEGSSVVGMGRTLALWTTFAKPDLLRRLLALTLVPAINVGTELADRVAGSSNDQFSANCSAWAKK